MTNKLKFIFLYFRFGLQTMMFDVDMKSGILYTLSEIRVRKQSKSVASVFLFRKQLKIEQEISALGIEIVKLYLLQSMYHHYLKGSNLPFVLVVWKPNKEIYSVIGTNITSLHFISKNHIMLIASKYFVIKDKF